ncbi:hypothetical protein CCR75_002302 [Bremia lactucae]|uniref:Uncharacterized protein n=1 Tax=Bremia lactucae TaxID=4779 RepID=A0A976FGI7_BRELC|nr:hypothetical protein CCR75_002302 [Bremia lactucae]
MKVRYRRKDWERMPLKFKALFVVSASALGLYVVSHVETMPLTNRRRIMLLSRKYEEQLGEQGYREILSNVRLTPKSHPMSRAVARVGRMIEQKSNAPFMK